MALVNLKRIADGKTGLPSTIEHNRLNKLHSFRPKADEVLHSVETFFGAYQVLFGQVTQAAAE